MHYLTKKNILILNNMFENFNFFFLLFKELNIFFFKEEKNKENININMFKMLFYNIDDISSNIILINKQNKKKKETSFFNNRSYDLNLWSIFYKYNYNLIFSSNLDNLIEDISSYNKMFFYLKRYKKNIINFNVFNKKTRMFDTFLGSSLKSFFYSFVKTININFLINKKKVFIFAFYYFSNNNIIPNISKNKYGFNSLLFFQNKFNFYFQEFFGKIVKNFITKKQTLLTTYDLKISFNNSINFLKNTLNIFYYSQNNLYLFNDNSLHKVQKMYNFEDKNLNIYSFYLWKQTLLYNKITKRFTLHFSIWNFIYSLLFFNTLTKKNKILNINKNNIKKIDFENNYLSIYLNNINRSYNNKENSIALKEYFLFNLSKNNKNFI